MPTCAYANVRPTKILPGITSPLAGVGPGDLDWVILRETSEGECSGHEIQRPTVWYGDVGRNSSRSVERVSGRDPGQDAGRRDQTVHMAKTPRRLDTIAAANLQADILSDLAGSLGVVPPANIDPERRFPSIFEPIHDSAVDIAGKGIENSGATFWAAWQMHEHRDEQQAAERLLQAVVKVCEAGSWRPTSAAQRPLKT